MVPDADQEDEVTSFYTDEFKSCQGTKDEYEATDSPPLRLARKRTDCNYIKQKCSIFNDEDSAAEIDSPMTVDGADDQVSTRTCQVEAVDFSQVGLLTKKSHPFEVDDTLINEWERAENVEFTPLQLKRTIDQWV